MPILPLFDLLLLLGTGSLVVGFLLKAIALTTRLRPSLLGFTSIDFVLIAAVCMGFAMVLAARTWVKLNEPKLLEMQRRSLEEGFRREQRALEDEAQGLGAGEERAAEDGVVALGREVPRRARGEGR